MRTRPTDPADGPPARGEEGASTEQAAEMLRQADDFGIRLTYSMCYPEDIGPLRQRFGDRLAFNGSIHKKPDEPDDAAYRLLDQYLANGVKLLKFWAAPRGRDRGLLLDTPWRIESARRARSAGIRVIMVHVGDPDAWFRKVYTDVAKYGTKADQYRPLVRLLEEFSDLTWIAAHMGGDAEHPDHLEELIERFPNIHFDTSATKWQVREVSARRDAVRGLILRHPDRFLFGSDLVTRHGLEAEHYASRYWCQRTLWESDWEGISPIADADYTPENGGPSTPLLRGLGLPPHVLDQVYHGNAERLIQSSRTASELKT
jgi:Amidohydrolase